MRDSLSDLHEQSSRLLRQIHAYLRLFERMSATGEIGRHALLRRPCLLKAAVPERWPGAEEPSPELKAHAYREAIHAMRGVIDELQYAHEKVGSLPGWTAAYVPRGARRPGPGYVWTGEEPLKQVVEEFLEPARRWLAQYGLHPRAEAGAQPVGEAPPPPPFR